MAVSLAKRPRYRKVDPLHEALKYIEDGGLKKLKSLLKNDSKINSFFKDRLTTSRVDEGHSPLVTAVLNNRFEVFKYIVKNFRVNVEQETSAVIEGGYPVEGATPLWTASTLGYMDFVKLLVAKGANIEHTTDSKSSPLRGAAFDGHCEVCEFLIDNKADIDKPNQVGQSPLTIAAAMQKKECVELLIKKGADVNHKGHNGDTPLHVSVESGAVEIAKILVKAGAKNRPNDVGFTPAILACCYGHDDVMDYLNNTFHLKSIELYNCYCLLAAKAILGSHDDQAETWMNEAIKLRSFSPDQFDIPAACEVYDGIQEPSTTSDVQNILQDEIKMFFVSSIYCERILGHVHPTTAFYIRISGDMALAEERYEKCVELWQRSLDFDNAARMAYELQITEDLLFAIRGISIMADSGFTAPVEPHFRWGLKEFKMAHESKISDIGVLSCLFRMIGVWIKVADSIKEKEKREKEHKVISVAVQDMMSAMEGNKCPVLIACLQALPEHGSGATKDIFKSKIPLHKAIVLLLDHGCTVHCEDKDGNFPLHLAVKLQEDTAIDCIRTLLEYGAHLDAVNFDNKTAIDVCDSEDMVQGKALSELQPLLFQHTTLQCLASRVLIKHKMEYTKVLPKRLIEFVSWHESDQNSTAVRSEKEKPNTKNKQNKS